MVEAVNFAMDVLSQEMKHTNIIAFLNAPNFLSLTLAWLSGLPQGLFHFRETFYKLKREKSTIFDQSSTLLQDLFELDWLLAESRLQAQSELANNDDVWLNRTKKLLDRINPINRRVIEKLGYFVKPIFRIYYYYYYPSVAHFRGC